MNTNTRISEHERSEKYAPSSGAFPIWNGELHTLLVDDDSPNEECTHYKGEQPHHVHNCSFQLKNCELMRS